MSESTNRSRSRRGETLIITNAVRGIGKRGSNWCADIPRQPEPDLADWKLISSPGALPSVPTGADDLASADVAGTIDVTTTRFVGAQQILIINAAFGETASAT